MSELIDHLADLTGFRDRDVLDVTLVGAFKDLLRPVSVAIYRSVNDGVGERWLTRARLGLNDAVATSDPAWSDMEALPRFADFPARQRAMSKQQFVQVELPGKPHLSVFPLATERDVVGVLEIESNEPLNQQSQRMVHSILRIYRNFQGLLEYSERDTLTGLLNRKTFDESFMKASTEPRAEGEAADSERRAASGMVPVLGVIDIDHFKRVNDTYGHLIGDEVLLLLSRLMRSSFRFHDRLYRFGGEEFVVLMRCATADDAAQAFERLRAQAAAYPFPQVGQITVSIGFTMVKPGDTPTAAFERADKAVYFAKDHGRNCVFSHADLIAKGLLEDDSKTGDVELF